MSDSNSPSTVTTTLQYLEPPAEGVRLYLSISENPKSGKRDTNITRIGKETVIENIRGKEDTISLDTTGFQYLKSPARHTSFDNDEEVEKEYYPESIDLIKQVTGANKVVIFDHTIRRRRPGQLDDSPAKRQPVANVHIDQTTAASIARVHRHLPAEEAPELLKKRFQIINLWRPIKYPALDWPLALCDYRTVDLEKDTHPIALVYPDRTGETMGVLYNPNHRWKYIRGMTPEEVILIKCFDSIDDGSVSRFTPHTGFEDPTTPPDAPLRESIELRALVFYD